MVVVTLLVLVIFISYLRDRELCVYVHACMCVLDDTNNFVAFILLIHTNNIYCSSLLIRYCPNGTLRDQLLYPSTSHDDDNITFSEAGYWSDDDLLDILTAVDLPDLASRAGDGDPIAGINATLDWSNTLSLGEQQRLAFGRVLINRPRLVILDESTSALDVDAEQKMYILMKERLVSPTGIPVTYVSVGHRPSIIAFHDLKLLLHDGTGVASFISQGEVPNVSFEGESLLT